MFKLGISTKTSYKEYNRFLTTCKSFSEDIIKQVQDTKDEDYPVLILLTGNETVCRVHEVIKGIIIVF